MRRLVILLGLACSAGAHADDTGRYALTMADRLEYQFDPETVVWDLQGYYGDDYHKFWWKTEGDLEGGEIEEAWVDLLYSRAWTAFFDLQAGVRLDRVNDTTHTSLAVALLGLSPYRFEMDTTLLFDEYGGVRLQAEFERDFLVTQRLILQPRAEALLATKDTPELAVSSGFNELELELRLRYEFHRKFAPYLGVAWTRRYGDAATAAGSTEDTTVVAGLRAWF